MQATLYQPDYAFLGGKLVRTGLAVDSDGNVVASASTGAQVVRLPGKLLLPGLVNVHSHAFQRILRGRTEYLAKGALRDDFWSWRELMYRAVETMDPEAFYAVSKQAFLEMALAGITSVGEFHYVHHAPDGRPYADRDELAKQVIRAAREVGLRVVLLRTGYHRSGFEVPPNPRQRRFLDSEPGAMVEAVERLSKTYRDDALVTFGLAPHSVRAVPRSWLEAVAKLPKQLLHMHVAEQPAEVSACEREHGRRPVALLEELGLLHEQFTAIHGVHLTAAEAAALGTARATVCACPATERNLGDGIVPADVLLASGVSLALGTDSQANIDLLDDARQLELHLRLQHQRRAVLDPKDGELAGLGERLFHIASKGGARSLGLPEALLLPGAPADFFTVDLEHPSLVGTPPEALVPAVVFGAEKAAIQDVFVQGRPVIRDGEHPQARAISQAFVSTVKGLS